VTSILQSASTSTIENDCSNSHLILICHLNSHTIHNIIEPNRQSKVVFMFVRA